MDINLTLYAVQNEKGQFFRAKGYGGYGQTWVDDINKAKIYAKIGGARGTITWFANNYSKYPTPKLIKLTVNKFEVVDETERVNKAKEKKQKAEAERQKRNAEWEMQQAKKQLEEAQARVNQLSKK